MLRFEPQHQYKCAPVLHLFYLFSTSGSRPDFARILLSLGRPLCYYADVDVRKKDYVDGDLCAIMLMVIFFVRLFSYLAYGF